MPAVGGPVWIVSLTDGSLPDLNEFELQLKAVKHVMTDSYYK